MQSFASKAEFDMHWRLFDEMINRFNLCVTEIAETAGVSRVMLSRFRHGKADLGAAKLIALLLVVPHEARMWYVSELLGISPGTSLRNLIAQAPPEERVEALRLIADSFDRYNHKPESDVEAVELAEAV
jgi:transcriptional regulator with XRE-family HTH domain